MLGRGEMKTIDERLNGTACAGVAADTSTGCQQRAPRWLDDPFDGPLGVGDAQGRCGRKGMKNVAHGAETDHEQAKVGLRLQILIFSQGLQRTVGTEPSSKPVRDLQFIFNREREACDFERK